MTAARRVSIVVPTRGRPDAVLRLLRALARQTVPRGAAMEAVFAFDGEAPPPAVVRAAARAGFPVQLLALPRVGISEAKNLAVNQATGDRLLFLNDDVEPAPALVAEHLRAARDRHLVLGRTDWCAARDDTVLDRLIRSTSMVFFYDTMADGRAYGFRHAWNLNLSMPRDAFEEIGGFRCELRPCMHEDLELAWRLERKGWRVLYHAPARARHRHRYTWDDYMRREVLLGLMARVLGGINPGCFRAIWGAAPEALDRACRDWLALDRGDHGRLHAALAPLWGLPARTLPAGAPGLRALYAAHLPLKRRAFRTGFVEGAAALARAPWEDRGRLAAGLAAACFAPAPVSAASAPRARPAPKGVAA